MDGERVSVNYFTLFFCDESNRATAAAEKAGPKAPEGEGCPRCGGYVYAAEQMLARGRVSFLFIQAHLIFARIEFPSNGSAIQSVFQRFPTNHFGVSVTCFSRHSLDGSGNARLVEAQYLASKTCRAQSPKLIFFYFSK